MYKEKEHSLSTSMSRARDTPVSLPVLQRVPRSVAVLLRFVSFSPAGEVTTSVGPVPSRAENSPTRIVFNSRLSSSSNENIVHTY